MNILIITVVVLNGSELTLINSHSSFKISHAPPFLIFAPPHTFPPYTLFLLEQDFYKPYVLMQYGNG